MNERRNELHQNELAIQFDKLNHAIEPYSKPIAVVAVLAILGIAGWWFFQSQEVGQRSDATLQLIEAIGSNDAEVLEDVAQAYPDTVAAGWAWAFRGDRLMADGLNDLFVDRDTATELLETAKDAYSRASSIGGDPVLTARANFGLAKIAEAQGEVPTAVEAYEKVIANAESDAMKEFAERRVAFLSRADTGEFLAWFNTQDFAPADPSLPPSLPDLPALPDLPDLDLPDLELPELNLSDSMKGGEAGSQPAEASAIDLPEAGSAAETSSADGEAVSEKAAITVPPDASETPSSEVAETQADG